MATQFLSEDGWAEVTATASVSDATTSSKGVVQLAGDLAGTAASPQIAAGAIVNADISNSAAIAYGKLSLTTSIVNGDISNSAAIAYSKLALTGSITNSDVAVGAAIALSKLATDPLARANHTGSQTASTISDLATTVKAYRLDEFAAPTASVSLGSQKITNLADPSAAQEAATKAYVDSSMSSGATPDADATTKGKIQLAGDLTGTAASPQLASGTVGTSELASGVYGSASAITGVSTGNGSQSTVARSDHTHAVNFPRVSVYRSAASPSQTTNTDYTVLYDAENFDSDGFHSTSSNTSRLTVPAGLGGVYCISADVAWTGNATGARYVLFYLNGSSLGLGQSTQAVSGFATRLSATITYSLAAGDYIEIITRQTSGGGLTVTSTTASMFRIGA